MVEKRSKERKKRKRNPKPTQTISQKVIVNIGKGYGTKRRTGTQAKRSVQPQVIYQQQPVPLQPDYSSRINDLRDEVVRHLSGVDKEAGRRRALELRIEEGKQGTSVQSERQDRPPPPRRTRSDVGVPRGELLKTAQARAEERGFSLASVPVETPALAKPAPLTRQQTPPRVVTMLETIAEAKKTRGRPPGSQNVKRKLVVKPKEGAEEESPPPDPNFV